MASHPAARGPGGTRPLSRVPPPGTPFRAGAPFEQQKPPGVVGGETVAPTAFLLPGGRSLPAPGARSLSLWKWLLLGWEHWHPGSQGKSLKTPFLWASNARRRTPRSAACLPTLPWHCKDFLGGWLPEQDRAAAHAPAVQVLPCAGLVLQRANCFRVI